MSDLYHQDRLLQEEEAVLTAPVLVPVHAPAPVRAVEEPAAVIRIFTTATLKQYHLQNVESSNHRHHSLLNPAHSNLRE